MPDIRVRLGLIVIAVLVSMIMVLHNSTQRDLTTASGLLGMSTTNLESELDLDLEMIGPWYADGSFYMSSDRVHPVEMYGREWILTEYDQVGRVNGVMLVADYPGDEEYARLVSEIAYAEGVEALGDSGIDVFQIDRIVRLEGAPGRGMTLLVCDELMTGRYRIWQLEQDLQDLDRFRQ